MKNFKKIASAIAALLLAACVAVPMSATVFTASAAVEIQVEPKANSQDEGTHKYEAYKIFSGTMETVAGGTDEKVLVGLDWAFKTDVDGEKKTEFLGKIGSTLSVGTLSATPTASEVAAVIKGVDDNDKAIAFSNLLGQYLDLFDKTSPNGDGKLTVNDAGYYLVQDAEAPELGDNNSGAKTRYILEVVDPDKTPLTIEAKSAAPTVDKQVFDTEETSDTNDKQDQTADAPKDGWGETADHTIGEEFAFKLIAQLPNEDEINSYEKYKLVFHDTMSKGVDFVGNVKVTWGSSNEIKATADTSPTAGVASGKFEKDGVSVGTYVVTNGEDGVKKLEVTFEDVKALGEDIALKNLKLEVTYDAKLNDQAFVNKTSGATTNQNEVYLEYSNNPNVHGEGAPGSDTGTTPKDIVWVYTYEIDSTKYKESVGTENILGGATFKLYRMNGANKEYAALDDTDSTNGNWTFTKWEVDEDKDGSEGTLMTSNATSGQFNVKGLDAGTYFIEEVDAPAGYNKLTDPIQIDISGEHSETGANNNVTLKYAKDSAEPTESESSKAYVNEVINNKGASLPSTGGIGTTLFYLGGGALVAVAGVMLITKKRMTKE